MSLCHMAGLGPGRLQGEADTLQSHMARLCSSLAMGSGRLVAPHR